MIALYFILTLMDTDTFVDSSMEATLMFQYQSWVGFDPIVADQSSSLT